MINLIILKVNLQFIIIIIKVKVNNISYLNFRFNNYFYLYYITVIFVINKT